MFKLWKANCQRCNIFTYKQLINYEKSYFVSSDYWNEVCY